MLGVHYVEVIVFEYVHKGEKRTVYPSSSLVHEIYVVFHRVSPSFCIRDIL